MIEQPVAAPICAALTALSWAVRIASLSLVTRVSPAEGGGALPVGEAPLAEGGGALPVGELLLLLFPQVTKAT